MLFCHKLRKNQKRMLLWVSVTNEKKHSKAKIKQTGIDNHRLDKKYMPTKATSVASLVEEGSADGTAPPVYVLVWVAPVVDVVVVEVVVPLVPELEEALTVEGVLMVAVVPLRAANPIRFWS